MPPLRTYIFKHKITTNCTITLKTYGDIDAAWKRLTNLVINTNDWYL